MKEKLKILELFSGIRAFSTALERLGIEYECVDSVEIDKYAIKSQNAMFGTNFEPQDITQWDKDIEVDLIMHGSPCQDFSLAGKQAGGDKDSGTRSSLLYETVRIVSKLKPKYVIWENVKNVLSQKHKHNFDNYLSKMEQLGYTNYYQVLNAKDYGIPQNRERVFTISILNDYEQVLDNIQVHNDDFDSLESHWEQLQHYFEFPPKQELTLRLKDMLEDEVDEKYYLSDKMLAYMTDMTDRNGFVRGKRFNPLSIESKYAYTVTTAAGNRPTDNFINEPICLNSKGGRGGIEGLQPSMQDRVYDEQGISTAVTTSFMPSIAVKEATKKGYKEAYDGDSVNLAYPESKTRRGRVGEQVSQTLQCNDSMGVVEYSEYSKKKIEENIKAINNELSGTLTANCMQSINHDNCQMIRDNLRIRKLTPLECWRLMGFDDKDFEKASQVNSNAQLYKQAGNSICVPVLENILKELFKEDQQ